jgi:eukaryotic-like serine/threonine-protein kinase
VVPNVVGLFLCQAVRRIARAHCRPGRVTRVRSTRHNKNRVLAQNPRPGRRLRQGAKVNLTVGKGPRR